MLVIATEYPVSVFLHTTSDNKGLLQNKDKYT